ncbi:hypothetical protein [Streptomyces carpinensis]|uniref:Uncharacterized protein n=1 Tax=Streptomyces carpinensis TaxID=66369 RepID=A0ABV1W6Z1_9ACTN|nr:hypothetical protein [Streptomyces carpinensis]
MSESARAASAAESRFRMDVPITRRLAERPWAHARRRVADGVPVPPAT